VIRLLAGGPRNLGSIVVDGNSFFFLRSIQIGFRAHPASCSADIVAFFPRGKAVET
jgi:hypothetical protein